MIQRPLRTAAWSGVILFALSLFIMPAVSYYLFDSLSSSARLGIQTLSFFVTAGFYFLIFNGFSFLGKKLDNKTLVFASWFLFVSILISTLIMFSASGQFYDLVQSTPINDPGFEDLPAVEQETIINDLANNRGDEILSFFSKILLVLFIYFVSTIVFGVGLVKSKGVELSKVTGIFFIVGGATLFIFVGIFVLAVANILAIILLFRASNSFESEEDEDIKPKKSVSSAKKSVVSNNKKAVKPSTKASVKKKVNSKAKRNVKKAR